MSDLICELVKETDPFLREKPEIFNFESPQVDPEKLQEQLIENMIHHEGLGLSANQIGPPAVSPSHTPELIQLYSGHQPSGVSFSKELANILDTWTKTWVVSGLIPGAPPVPFSGPLS